MQSHLLTRLKNSRSSVSLSRGVEVLHAGIQQPYSVTGFGHKFRATLHVQLEDTLRRASSLDGSRFDSLAPLPSQNEAGNREDERCLQRYNYITADSGVLGS